MKNTVLLVAAHTVSAQSISQTVNIISGEENCPASDHVAYDDTEKKIGQWKCEFNDVKERTECTLSCDKGVANGDASRICQCFNTLGFIMVRRDDCFWEEKDVDCNNSVLDVDVTIEEDDALLNAAPEAVRFQSESFTKDPLATTEPTTHRTTRTTRTTTRRPKQPVICEDFPYSHDWGCRRRTFTKGTKCSRKCPNSRPEVKKCKCSRRGCSWEMVRECSNNIARGRPEPVDHFDDDFDFDSHFSNMANDIQLPHANHHDAYYEEVQEEPHRAHHQGLARQNSRDYNYKDYAEPAAPPSRQSQGMPSFQTGSVLERVASYIFARFKKLVYVELENE